MTPPDIAATWTWTGDRQLPDWLARHHHWHADRPVIHTTDGPRHLYDQWMVILWTDGAITVASATVAQRVYGDDGLVGRLERAEHEVRRYAEAESADAAGSYAGRVEELEAGHARIRRLAARIRQGAPWTANHDNLADRIEGALDGTTGLDIPVDKNSPDSGNPQANTGGELDNPADNPPATNGLRARLAHTLRSTPNRHATGGLGFPDHHGPGEPGYLGWCALCTRDVDALTDALLTALTDHLEIGEEQAWCRYCRRAWDSPRHRCESDAEQRVYQIAELRDRWHMAGAPPLGTSINRWVDRRLAELNAVLNEEPGPHRYLSTGCLHGDHDYCKAMTGLNGSKRPAECKHCQAKCICGCHTTTKEA